MSGLIESHLDKLTTRVPHSDYDWVANTDTHTHTHTHTEVKLLYVCVPTGSFYESQNNLANPSHYKTLQRQQHSLYYCLSSCLLARLFCWVSLNLKVHVLICYFLIINQLAAGATCSDASSVTLKHYGWLNQRKPTVIHVTTGRLRGAPSSLISWWSLVTIIWKDLTQIGAFFELKAELRPVSPCSDSVFTSQRWDIHHFVGGENESREMPRNGLRCFVSVVGKQNEYEDSRRRKSEIKTKHWLVFFVLIRKLKWGFIFFLGKLGSTITPIIYGELE